MGRIHESSIAVVLPYKLSCFQKDLVRRHFLSPLDPLLDCPAYCCTNLLCQRMIKVRTQARRITGCIHLPFIKFFLVPSPFHDVFHHFTRN